MYICICKAVTDREIRQCADLGACSLNDLRDCLGVASNCGQCAQAATEVLDRHIHAASLAQAA